MDIKDEWDKRGFVEHMVVEAITKSFPNGMPTEFTKKDHDWDLTMQFNGIEIDPLAFIGRLEECYEEQVKDAAKEMVDEIKEEALEPFNEFIEDLIEKVTKTVDVKFGS